MAVITWVETTAEAIFGDNQFYKWLTTVFATKNHTHSGYASSSHTHTVSDITDNTFTLKDTITKNGATAKVYANNTFVYIKYSGTVSLTANTNLNMGTLANTSYAPTDYEYAPINHVGSDIGIYGAINGSGVVYVINDSSRTSVELHGGIMYPLTSKISDS